MIMELISCCVVLFFLFLFFFNMHIVAVRPAGGDEDVGERQESWADFDGGGKLEKEL